MVINLRHSHIPTITERVKSVCDGDCVCEKEGDRERDNHMIMGWHQSRHSHIPKITEKVKSVCDGDCVCEKERERKKDTVS